MYNGFQCLFTSSLYHLCFSFEGDFFGKVGLLGGLTKAKQLILHLRQATNEATGSNTSAALASKENDDILLLQLLIYPNNLTPKESTSKEPKNQHGLLAGTLGYTGDLKIPGLEEKPSKGRGKGVALQRRCFAGLVPLVDGETIPRRSANTVSFGLKTLKSSLIVF